MASFILPSYALLLKKLLSLNKTTYYLLPFLIDIESYMILLCLENKFLIFLNKILLYYNIVCVI